MSADRSTTTRQRIRVTGTVQGVGFRPFVYRTARELGLSGFVGNDPHGVLIEVEGEDRAVTELRRRLVTEAPPLARVADVTSTAIRLTDGPAEAFHIVETLDEGAASVPVGVDTATCPACLAEVDDPTDRRYRYPFTNCTDCGPRYTIVRRVPYDRPTTTMAGFAMCVDCRREYDDPDDRRFHAQPNACAVCGPRLAWTTPDGGTRSDGDEALVDAIAAVSAGGVVAMKGVGGYHLVCDATDQRAVTELRRRKERDDKPFAVMVTDVDALERLCVLDPVAEREVRSGRRPIVLLRRRPEAALAPAIAPGLPELGVMLPYSALHHLVMRGVDRPLVMTSGNHSDEPIAHADADAVVRLGPLVDGILAHDRPIHIRCDDSVVRVARNRSQVLRRSRGYAPEPLPLPIDATRPTLAVGAELKSTVALARRRSVVMSQHLGDLEHLATYTAFRQAVEHVCHLSDLSPALVAHDLHPEYLSTKFARDLDLPTCPVQHHHAHIASCLAEHGHTGPVVGVAFDGLGFGDDATLWGGELLVADLVSFERVGHLRPVALPGGVMAIREPWRTGLAWAHAAGGAEAAARSGPALDERWPAVLSLVEQGVGPVTTSMGRLFDAVAALLGIRSTVSYEGQAAIELEALARTAGPGTEHHLAGDLVLDHGTLVLDPRPLVAGALAAVGAGSPPAAVAAGFHQAIARLTVDAAARVASARSLDTVALSGGVFQNALLTASVVDGLSAAGLRVLVHELVPPNDGGISLGQAAVAAARDRLG